MNNGIKLDENGSPHLTTPDGTEYAGRLDTVGGILRRTDLWYRSACADGTAVTSPLGMEYARRLAEGGTGTCCGVTAAAGFGIVVPALTGTVVPGLIKYEVPSNAGSADIICGLHALAESPSLAAEYKAELAASEITVFERTTPLGTVLRRHH